MSSQWECSCLNMWVKSEVMISDCLVLCSCLVYLGLTLGFWFQVGSHSCRQGDSGSRGKTPLPSLFELESAHSAVIIPKVKTLRYFYHCFVVELAVSVWIHVCRHYFMVQSTFISRSWLVCVHEREQRNRPRWVFSQFQHGCKVNSPFKKICMTKPGTMLMSVSSIKGRFAMVLWLVWLWLLMISGIRSPECKCILSVSSANLFVAWSACASQCVAVKLCRRQQWED